MSDADGLVAKDFASPHAPARLASIEWLRIGACLGIVAFHCQTPGHQVMLGGLHAFVTLTVAFASRSTQTLLTYARTRWRALGVPWVGWSAIYGAEGLAYAIRHHRPIGWTWWTLLSGPAIHLWFLPFALVVTMVARACAPAVGARTWALLAFASLWPRHALHDLPSPVSQWLSVVPAALIGPAIAHIRPGTGRTTYVLAAIGGGVLFALVAYGWTDVTPLLVSLPVCALVWEIPAPAGARLLRWSRLTFGVYLVHPLLMHILSRWSAGNPWLEAAMVAVGSFAAIEIIRRTPLARFVGENTAAARSG